MADKVAIPGVTFWVESADYKDSATFVAKGTVHLTADIDDLEIWEEVIRRLDGFRAHAIDDFHRQMMMSLREENEQLTTDTAKVREESRVVKEQAEQATAMSIQQVSRLTMLVREYELALQHHRNTATDTQNLLNLLVPPGEVVGSGS
jgi:hypothetical protein